jgi:hypothetical protein
MENVRCLGREEGARRFRFGNALDAALHNARPDRFFGLAILRAAVHHLVQSLDRGTP